jgi:hypothetical protein
MTGNNHPLDSRLTLERIESAISGLRYGTVEITVHDGRVVQIERTEKIRLGTDRPDSTNTPRK